MQSLPENLCSADGIQQCIGTAGWGVTCSAALRSRRARRSAAHAACRTWKPRGRLVASSSSRALPGSMAGAKVHSAVPLTAPADQCAAYSTDVCDEHITVDVLNSMRAVRCPEWCRSLHDVYDLSWRATPRATASIDSSLFGRCWVRWSGGRAAAEAASCADTGFMAGRTLCSACRCASACRRDVASSGRSGPHVNQLRRHDFMLQSRLSLEANCTQTLHLDASASVAHATLALLSGKVHEPLPRAPPAASPAAAAARRPRVCAAASGQQCLQRLRLRQPSCDLPIAGTHSPRVPVMVSNKEGATITRMRK
jgi:hypothetical protein